MPLLQQLGAASFTTFAGWGLVDRAYPFHFGSLLVRSCVKSVFGSVDLVLVIGSELFAGDLWRAQEIQTRRRAWQRQVDLERPGILPTCRALQAALPQDAMIFSDMTQFAYLAKEIWPMSKPGHLHHPTGVGTLGYALPAAIGGAIGRPGLPTAAIIGDYGFQYSLPELGVAAELGFSLPIILWDNTKLQEV